ncbi:hypothetical protein [Schleiferia thermophila]|jgi:hypothetical protein|uniref:Uncharacterized protein n=1 Tax=Schleiferia thermophila TaxID=884107 RepID=A0A369A969_9FLAO|nr:hypothetical protein [Schleiferia thermophila]RCX05671.1 hypothetical protein DES35_101959 [Schleiferia thermophila]GCD78840.1 hypothetical protein JCM30197_00870 [Schleiferia thermophila]
MKHIALIAIALFSIELSQAQKVKKNAELYTKPGVRVLFIIPEGTEVYTGPMTDNWYPVSIEVMIRKAEMSGHRIAQGASVFIGGKEVGIMPQQWDVPEIIEATGRHKDKYRVIIEGYLFKTKVDETTKPETEIEKIINRKGNIQAALTDWIAAFKPEKHILPQGTVYIVRDHNRSLKGDRIRMLLFLKGDNKLTAVVTDSHPLTARFRHIQYEEPFIYHFPLGKPSPNDWKEIEEIVLKFTPL